VRGEWACPAPQAHTAHSVCQPHHYTNTIQTHKQNSPFPIPIDTQHLFRARADSDALSLAPFVYRRQSVRVVKAKSEFARSYHLELFTCVYIVESEKMAKGEGKREEEQWQQEYVCAGRHTYSHLSFSAFIVPFFYNRQLFRFLVSDLTCLSHACGQGGKSLRRYTNLLRRYTNDAPHHQQVGHSDGTFQQAVSSSVLFRLPQFLHRFVALV
jgi:hypothetical protein